ncbi:MAG: MFS transporter, partial [Deltaproteobacteria bacterium]|nr:MFS transporter [Deltaproteobacteria bacterium]
GGWLTDQYGWPWIFYINVPFSILGTFMVSLFVEDPLYLRRGLKQVDWIGIGLLAVGLTTMQVVLERGQDNNWFESGWIIAGAVITAFALLGLAVWDFRSREPVVNFRLLRDVPLSTGCSMGLIFGITFYGTTFSLPALLQNLLGYPAYEAGLVLLPRGVSLLLLLPVVGWLYNKVDPRILLMIGIALVYSAYEKIAHLSADVDFWTIVLPLMIMGAGMPFMFVTMTTVSLSTIKPKDMTTASGLYTLGRRVGGNIGYALTATLVDRRFTFHRARLVERITQMNPTFGGLHAGLSAQMIHRGFDPAAAQSKALALIQGLFGVMLIAILPLILLFPGRRSKARGIKEVPF